MIYDRRMPDRPRAEVVIDEPLVRGLLGTQAYRMVDAAAIPLRHVDEGWDCSVWRLGDDLAVRLPRRAVAAPLVANEQRWLPSIAARVEGIGIPAPVLAGRPDATFAWPWSVVPWFEGESGLRIPRSQRTGWAPALARALTAVHTPADADHPANPFRGVPLRERADSIASAVAAHRQRRALREPSIDGAERAWAAGLAADAWSAAPVWIHGDLHPGNLVARGEELVAIIDFGDLTAGDPAYDLAIAWLAFDDAGRRAFRDALSDRYDDQTWTRARAWAAGFTLLLLARSDDDPAYRGLGRECLAELTA